MVKEGYEILIVILFDFVGDYVVMVLGVFNMNVKEVGGYWFGDCLMVVVLFVEVLNCVMIVLFGGMCK